MNLRFILAAIAVASWNAFVSFVIAHNHSLFETQEFWRYMMRYAGWPWWSAAFAISAAGIVLAIPFGRDAVVRGFVSLGIVVMSMLTASMLLIPFDPHSKAITYYTPGLNALAISLQLLFLALPARDWLDRIVIGKSPTSKDALPKDL